MQLQEGSISIEAPAINLSTAELIQVSGIPPEQLAWAHSCHKSNFACGECRGCNKYFGVRKELGYELD
jgi:7-cyano-7-deazaguanine synthase